MKVTTKEVSKLIKNLIWVFCISLVAFYFIKINFGIYVFTTLGTLILAFRYKPTSWAAIRIRGRI